MEPSSNIKHSRNIREPSSMHYQVVFNEWYHVSYRGYKTKVQHQASLMLGQSGFTSRVCGVIIVSIKAAEAS
jgi:hypothetical protein